QLVVAPQQLASPDKLKDWLQAMSASTTPQHSPAALPTPEAFFSAIVTNDELSTYIAEYLRTNKKEIWIDRLRILLKSIPDTQLSRTSVRELISSAPVFSVWSSDATRVLSRRLLSPTAFSTHVELSLSLTRKTGATQALATALKTDPSSWLKTSSSSSTFSRAKSMAREAMATNVSEASERIAYGNAKGIATWYFNKRREDSENRDLMDLTPADAWELKRIEDEHAQQQKREEKKRKAEAEATLGVEEPKKKLGVEEPKKKRRKFLATAAEEKAHWEEKAKRRAEAKALQNAQSVKESGFEIEAEIEAVVDAEEPAGKSIRSMAFRLYPSEALAQGLKKWIDIADAIDAHVKDVLEAFAARSEKASFRYLRDEHICLTAAKLRKGEADGTLHQLRDLERRREYVSLPFDVQQAVIKESVANFTANQTNFEKGNNDGFETRSRDGARRWKTLKFLATGMCVNRKSGEVTMSPRSDFVEKGADRGMYIKDRLIAFLCPSRQTKKHTARAPTKHWGNHLQCGKNKEGRAFTVRYDTLDRKWYLILAYDARVKGAPLRESVFDSIANDSRPTAIRAKTWIERQDSLFAGHAARGNMCSIDPGARTPWTCFDANRKEFYDVYPDLVATLANHHNEVALIQSFGAPRLRKEGSRCRRKRRKKKRQAKGSRGRKHQRNWRRSWQRRMTDKHDLMKATVRQAHNSFANHLVRAYDVIVMPEFMTAGMVRKRRQQLKLPGMKEADSMNGVPREGRFTLHKTTRKAMRWISHFAFRQRLFAKALADPHEVKDVICTTEEYSTKQCPYCEFVHHKIGSSKIFKCGKCGFIGRRDNVGAFNICLRSIVKGE
ncbi:hypothetical protein HDU87_003161, partial [Geranomyces variabilis]